MSQPSARSSRDLPGQAAAKRSGRREDARAKSLAQAAGILGQRPLPRQRREQPADLREQRRQRRRRRSAGHLQGLRGDDGEVGQRGLEAGAVLGLPAPGGKARRRDVVLAEAAALAARQEIALGGPPRRLDIADLDHPEIAHIAVAVDQLVGQQRAASVEQLRDMAVGDQAQLGAARRQPVHGRRRSASTASATSALAAGDPLISASASFSPSVRSPMAPTMSGASAMISPAPPCPSAESGGSAALSSSRATAVASAPDTAAWPSMQLARRQKTLPRQTRS